MGVIKGLIVYHLDEMIEDNKINNVCETYEIIVNNIIDVYTYDTF